MFAIHKIPSWILILVAALVGIVSGEIGHPLLLNAASTTSELFVRLLKLVSGPIIFFSLASTLTGMGNVVTIKKLGLRILRYTLLTTIIASCVALLIFVIVDPVSTVILAVEKQQPTIVQNTGYLNYIMQIIPDNMLEPFLEGKVISILFLALLVSFATLTLPEEQSLKLAHFFKITFAVIMQVTHIVLLILPIAVWALVTEFVCTIEYSNELKVLGFYLVCVLSANLFQSIVVLPLLLKWKRINVIQTLKGIFPALAVAFLTKSSSAALPTALKAAESGLNLKKSIAQFGFPLCTTINMNACAAFILITVMFVSGYNGIEFSGIEKIAWIFIATLSAIGNAGVPMGCYLLASSILTTMNVPIQLMGVILPAYVLIDMLESAINIWSDTCVVSVVNKECSDEIV